MADEAEGIATIEAGYPNPGRGRTASQRKGLPRSADES
jgi:hypothetical protein